MHGFQHLAKVRVAGSNPVVRSEAPVQTMFSRFWSGWTEV
jgi:hypothetical protein